MSAFNPDSIGVPNGNMWALPIVEKPAVSIIGVPWSVTCSQGDGTLYGPSAVLAASPLIALDDPAFWNRGVRYYGDAVEKLTRMSTDARTYALRVIEALSSGRAAQMRDINFVRDRCNGMCSIVELMTHDCLRRGSKVLLLGGDHSTPLGAINATHRRKGIDTILHIDAHADMYDAYEGFTYSHASIMHNVRKTLPEVRIVHVGLRDMAMCESIAMTGDRLPIKPPLHVVYDNGLLRKTRVENGTLKLALDSIVSELRGNTYISFDIDGLDPSLCPNTGTPVMGGLREDEYRYLFDLISTRIDAKLISLVGADLVEVAPASSDPETWEGDWDANVGMRVLYDLTKLLLR